MKGTCANPAGVGNTVVNGPQFEAQTWPEPKITSPNLARAWKLFLI